MWRCYCLQEPQDSSLVLEKGMKMINQLSKSSGAVKIANHRQVYAAWNFSEAVISSLFADKFGRKREISRPTNNSLRLTSVNLIHTMTLESLSTYATPPEPSEWTKTSIAGQIFRNFLVAWRVGSWQCWHEWARCGGIPAFQSPN